MESFRRKRHWHAIPTSSIGDRTRRDMVYDNVMVVKGDRCVMVSVENRLPLRVRQDWKRASSLTGNVGFFGWEWGAGALLHRFASISSQVDPWLGCVNCRFLIDVFDNCFTVNDGSFCVNCLFDRCYRSFWRISQKWANIYIL